MEVPEGIDRLVDDLAASSGVEAVVVGGSRATGDARPDSDWDLGLYYRGRVDLSALAARGTVHPPGSWGRVMNGGAWLDVDGTPVDVLLRDLDVVEHWTAEANAGRFEVDGLLGYVAGIPTYSLTAEATLAWPVRGDLVVGGPFPEALVERAAWRWRYGRDFSLEYARQHARRDNVVGTFGQLSRAIFEEGHARRCERREWVLNEKRLLDGCGLEGLSAVLGDLGAANDLVALVAAVAAGL